MMEEVEQFFVSQVLLLCFVLMVVYLLIAVGRSHAERTFSL